MATTKKQVLCVTEREVNGEKKTFWTRIGVAFENKDGSMTLLLDALPLSGKLQVRDDDRAKDDPSKAPF